MNVRQLVEPDLRVEGDIDENPIDDLVPTDLERKSRLRRRSCATTDGFPAELVTVELVDVGHDYGVVDVLRNVDLSIAPMTNLGIVGPSGCGKSTLLRMIAGLIEPTRGQISIAGDVTAKGRLARCALMPQHDLLLPWRSALDNACLALENRGMSRTNARAKAQPLFERFGLAAFEKSLPGALSGGMRQRVSFLRTLLADKSILCLDEPFGALDAITRGEMQGWLLSALSDVPRTTVLITHDVEEALLLCESVIVLSSRPSRIVRSVTVDMDKSVPRLEIISDPHFVSLKHDVLEALGW